MLRNIVYKFTRLLQALSKGIVLAGVLFFASCKNVKQRRLFSERGAMRVLVDEARLNDISIPLGVTLEGVPLSVENNHAAVMTYTSNMSLKILSDFYHADMERLGWREVSIFSLEDETLLVYEKPHKMVLVSMRPYDSSIQVLLYLAPR